MKKVLIYSKFERFWHWTQASLVILLILTGFEIHSTIQLFGFEVAVRIHEAAAWAFIILIVFAFFWLLVTKQYKQFIPTLKNIKAQMNYYLFGIFKNAPHPTKKTTLSKLNPLQRLVYFALLILVFPTQMITGILYMYHHFPNQPFKGENLETIAVLHTFAAFLIVGFFIAHLYLITTGHTIGSNLNAMITGYEALEDHNTENDNENKNT